MLKINSYITKKVADKLNELFKEDKKEYESKWKDIGIFVKYGMISEEKFYEKAIEFALVESLDGKFRTIPEYQKFIKKIKLIRIKIVLFYTPLIRPVKMYI